MTDQTNPLNDAAGGVLNALKAAEAFLSMLRDDGAGLLSEGVHAGLRKGTDAPDAATLWKVISVSKTTAWPDAIAFALDPFFSMWGGDEALKLIRAAIAALPPVEPADGGEARCGDDGRLCGACSLPAHLLTQEPGCGGPLLTPEPLPAGLEERARALSLLRFERDHNSDHRTATITDDTLDLIEKALSSPVVEMDPVRELGLLYNYADDDSPQFTRHQMFVAIRHGARLNHRPMTAEVAGLIEELRREAQLIRNHVPNEDSSFRVVAGVLHADTLDKAADVIASLSGLNEEEGRVPREPTEEMIEAGLNAPFRSLGNGQYADADPADIWTAMHDAATKALTGDR